ncbi:MAG: glycosyltransferase family 9 protein [Gammaproteobacteria bacterium]|nr:glycosyltransferase family 9 protein [Gammaproteobacteria bacterium]
MKLLVTRFSAMGDVALVTPALRTIIAANPGIEITLVTRKLFAGFFNDMEGVRVVTADLKGRHKGIKGIWRLYRELADEGFDAYVDLHNVLRSKLLGLFVRLGGVSVVRLDKGRREKRAYIAGMSHQPLKHTVERYLETFDRLGLNTDPASGPSIHPTAESRQQAEAILQGLGIRSGQHLVGVAPFAMHAPKMWPLENMRQVLEALDQRGDVSVLLFGGGEKESSALETVAADFSRVHSVAGRYGLEQELGLMSRLTLMLSMDSSNMHLASLLGVPTFSIWGGTHPDLGFRAWGQEAGLEIQPPIKLACRPCSVYGGKPCRYGEPKCMQSITPQSVSERLLSFLDSSSR